MAAGTVRQAARQSVSPEAWNPDGEPTSTAHSPPVSARRRTRSIGAAGTPSPKSRGGAARVVKTHYSFGDATSVARGPWRGGSVVTQRSDSYVLATKLNLYFIFSYRVAPAE